MKTYTFDQGSPEWFRAREGVLTASRAKALVTAAGKVSKGKGVESTINELVAEMLLGESAATDASGPWMERGTALEAEARSWFAYEHGVEVEQVGFLTDDAGRIGCSPDGLIGTDGGLELKVPSAKVMIGYVRHNASLLDAYRHQVMLSLLVSGRSWWYLAAYNPSPRIPNIALRVEPDEAYLDALREAIPPVLAAVDAALATIDKLCPYDDTNPFS